MKKKTRKALKGSIKKWEKILDGTGTDLGSKNCPLCARFLHIEGIDLLLQVEETCVGCPVKKASGETCCRNTPYEKWWNHRQHSHLSLDDYSVGNKIECPECRKFAKQEVKFLRGLMP
jgi:hypothetical protein